MTEELLGAAVRLAIPLLFAALGELIVQRAGVVNVGIEGMMLSGALASVVVAHLSRSPWLGLLGGGMMGLTMAAVLAWLAVVAGSDLIVTGTGLNLLALGGTGFIRQAMLNRWDGGVHPAVFSVVEVPGLAQIPMIGRALFAQPAPTYVAFCVVFLVSLMLRHTGMGLRIRAAGEAPRALDAAGTSVVRLRVAAVLAGGFLGGVGGASLALAHAGTFVDGMTAGRGFIALALVICSGWRPWGVLLAALLFGFALAVQFELQTTTLLPYQLARMAPYAVTLLVLAVARGDGWAPSSLGKSYHR